MRHYDILDFPDEYFEDHRDDGRPEEVSDLYVSLKWDDKYIVIRAARFSSNPGGILVIEAVNLQEAERLLDSGIGAVDFSDEYASVSIDAAGLTFSVVSYEKN